MKTKKKGNALQAGVWYMLSNFLIKGIAFITMPIFTRLMTKSDIGDISVFTGWISILSVVITLNLGTSVIIAKFDFKDDYDQFLSSISVLGFISTCVVYIISWLCKDFILELLGIREYELHVMFLYLMFLPSMDVVLGKFRAEMKFKPVIILSVVSSFVSTGMALLCVWLFEDGLKGRVYGTYFPLIAINFSLFVFLVVKGQSVKKIYWKYALAISLPLIIHNLSGNILNSSDRIMIQKMCSSEDAAVYSVAYTCGMFANIIRNSMDSAWTPWVFEQLNEGRNLKIKQISKPYLLVFFCICILIMLISPELLFVLGGEGYMTAKYVVPPVIGGYMFSMLYSLYGGIERYYKMQQWFALFAAVSAILNLGLNYIFIPRFGYIAAAFTTQISCAVELFLHYLNVCKIKKTSYYDTKFIVLMVIICVMSTAFAEVLYMKNVLRFFFMIFLGFMIFFTVISKRETIKSLMAGYSDKQV